MIEEVFCSVLQYRLQHHRINEVASMVYDQMTERFYTQKLTPFETNMVLEEVRFVPIHHEEGLESVGGN